MKNYLTQIFLFCVATISLYSIIQIANLAVSQPNSEVVAEIFLTRTSASPTAPAQIMNMQIQPPAPHATVLAKAEPLPSMQAQWVAEPSPTQPLATLPPATLPPQAVIVPPATQTPVPLLQLAPIAGGDVVADEVVQASSVTLDTAPPAAVDEAVDTVVHAAVAGCAPTSNNGYTLIPMEAADAQRPDSQHGDLNLGLRGYQASNAAHEFVSYNGDPDAGAPQWAGLFADHRRATITSVYQVRDWRWDCGEHGCAGDWLTNYDVTLMGVATSPGEAIFPPSRGAEIYGGGYVAVVLYAEASRLTLAYTRDGTVAHGYAAHFENLCVDPNLLAQYNAGNGGGRYELPGLRNGESVGTASHGEVLVAIRDRGMFMDPRSARDWAR